MGYFFAEQGRTRIFARGELEVRRGLKPADNAAQQDKAKNNHLVIETNGFPAQDGQLAGDSPPVISEIGRFSDDTVTGNSK